MTGVTRRALLSTAGMGLLSITLPGCAGPQVVHAAGPDPIYRRTDMEYASKERPGTIIIDPENHFLYLVQGKGRATRYGVGVGGEGYGWAGIASVHNKQEWPDWYPTKEYLSSHPKVLAALHELPSGEGMRGGPDNPMGARALYLWQGKKDTLYRIHGTNEPWTIGSNVSAGCIRMTNDDITDLYERVAVGAKVIVLPSKGVVSEET